MPDSQYILAQTMTGPGLLGVLFTFEPKFLCIDEIDRLRSEDISCLNSLMATKMVVETKFKSRQPIMLNTKVFAAGIDLARMPKDLMSRFIVLELKPYTEDEFINVVTHILKTDQGCSDELATYIAHEVWHRSHVGSDVRQCVQIARLSQGSLEEAKDIMRILKG
jgi:MoxR-like ATPase